MSRGLGDVYKRQGMRHELVNEIGREEVDADLLKWILNTARVAGQSF